MYVDHLEEDDPSSEESAAEHVVTCFQSISDVGR